MEELALHVLDLAQNSLAAGATLVIIIINEDTMANRLTIGIEDNGRGMESEFVVQVLDPFTTTRTTRRVGLGLPLLFMTARQCGGDLTIDSEPGRGTKVTATFELITGIYRRWAIWRYHHYTVSGSIRGRLSVSAYC